MERSISDVVGSIKCTKMSQLKTTETPTGVRVASSAAESDGDSADWTMEQDEAIDSLLCETPSLLPTLSLSLASGPQAPEGPTVAPAAAAAAATPTQTAVNSNNQGKGIKVRAQGPMMVKQMSSLSLLSLFIFPVTLAVFTDKGGEYHPPD